LRLLLDALIILEIQDGFAWPCFSLSLSLSLSLCVTAVELERRGRLHADASTLSVEVSYEPPIEDDIAMYRGIRALSRSTNVAELLSLVQGRFAGINTLFLQKVGETDRVLKRDEILGDLVDPARGVVRVYADEKLTVEVYEKIGDTNAMYQNFLSRTQSVRAFLSAVQRDLPDIKINTLRLQKTGERLDEGEILGDLVDRVRDNVVRVYGLEAATG